MSRRNNRIKRRNVCPDTRYNSIMISCLINKMMKRGKKSVAEKIVYTALSAAESRLGESAMSIFDNAVKNVTPTLEVRSRRIGGATYQIPVEVGKERAVSLALRWIVKAVKSVRKNKDTASYLCSELLDAYNNRGGAFKMCEDRYKMAESNRAFSHLNF